MTFIRSILTIALLALFMAMPLQADDHEKENIAMLALITPKAGHDEALIKAITDYHHWVANFEGHMRFNWFQIMTGPDTGKYAARSGGHSWADFDKSYDWQEKAGEVFEQNVMPHIDDMKVSYTSEMTDMSHWPEDWAGYSHFYIQEWYVHNGKGRQFRDGLKRIVDTLKAGGFPVHFGFHSTESGGYGNQVTFVSPKKGWADMSEKSPSFVEIMTKEFGDQEAFSTFMSEWSATFKSGRNYHVKRLPEASDYGK